MASGSGERRNWPTILGGCIGTAAGMALGWLALELAGITGFQGYLRPLSES